MRDKLAPLPTVLRKKLPTNLKKIKYGSYTKGDEDYAVHMYLKENDIRIDENGSEVIKFLRGKCVLVTGATGFLGKLLVEKLLRCCKDIETIYVIIRTKKGKDVETRLQEYLDDWSNETVSETVSTASTDTVSSQAMDSMESASESLHSFERPARGPTTNLSLPTSPKVSKLDSRLDLIDSPFLEGLEALLKKTAEGKILLNSRGKLTSIQRQKLTNSCFNELMGIYGDELSVGVLLKAAKEIPSIFALENSDTYMIPSQEGGPKGKLWHRYHNMRKAINLVNNHKKKCKDNKENESENSGTDAVEVSRYIDFLRVATEPLVKITEAWEATVKIRKNLYLNKTVSDIFKDFPCLKLDSGIQLIEMDFNLRHGDQMDIIYTTFPKVRDAILEEVKERKIIYDFQFEDQNLLAIVSLVYLFPPITLKKSRKGENWRPTRSEIMESYFMQVDTFEEFQERLAKRRDKLLEHKLTQQPFALVVGGSQFYIQVEDKSFKVESALRTLEFLFKAFFALEVFVKLSEIYPDYRKKVVGISGDFEKHGIGLSEDSRKILTEKVKIIYHAAATIRFDEQLGKAVQINIKGTREIIKLAKECKNFDVLTHISTAYSNCHFKEIKEEFYPPVMDADDLIELTDKMSSDVIDRITPGLINTSPNTYSFTKQIAEDVIRRESVGLPTCIQRPSIVFTTFKEPVRSWADNIFGPIGLIMGIALGILHTMYGDPNARCDFVPADYTINNCIAASYKTAKDRMTNKVQIFNFTTAKNNPLYWRNMNYMAETGFIANSPKVLEIYFCSMTKCWYFYKLKDFLVHTLPARIVDFVLVKLGKQPMLSKAYQKINKFVNIFSFFTLNEWDFVSNNTKELWDSLNEKDKSVFAYDMSTLDWQDYFDTAAPAVREFLILDNLDNLEEGKAHIKRLYLASFIVISVILVSTIYLCWNTIFIFIPIFMVYLIVYFTYTSHYR